MTIFIYNEKNEVIDLGSQTTPEEVSWYSISKDLSLSESFIHKFRDFVVWSDLSLNQVLSEKFIREHADLVDWFWISALQKLSEDFILEFKDRVFWDNISSKQKLSEDFIRKNLSLLNLDLIFIHQRLSEDFIREFKSKAYGLKDINVYQKLSNKFRKELGLKAPRLNWQNNTVNNKLRYIRKCNIRKCKLDKIYPLNKDKGGWYLTAYKSVRSDYSSVYNRQYIYRVGKTYESNCDCNLNEANSFGLSAWTKKEALEYYSSGKLLKVKIYLKDLGAIVYEGDKLRAFKLTVLEEVEK
jgi:hypothetical protein